MVTICECNSRIGIIGLHLNEVREAGEEAMLGFKGQKNLDMHLIDMIVDCMGDWLDTIAP